MIPIEHIGTDPSEATGFVKRRYDLGKAGLTREEISRVLRPQLIRDLARNARWHLEEVVEARRAAGLDVTELAGLLAAYPDPDASAEATLPRESFVAIAAGGVMLLYSRK